jgi:large conductance mechanosensitive channel
VSLASEFKEFAMKGNVIDLAVGVIIGTAFGKIVSSLVGDVFMPALGKIIGGINFSDLAVNLGAESIFDFIVIALVLFMCIRALNRLKEPAPVAAPAPPKVELLLEEIRDLLAKRV